MMVKASARPALIVATGLFFLSVSPMKAETEAPASTDSASSRTVAVATHGYVRHALRHGKGYAHRKTHAIAAKSADLDKSDQPAPAAAKIATDDGKTLPAIPASVANANAQMLLAGVQFSAAAAIPSGSNVQSAASDTSVAKADDGTFVVAADELNDVDRNLREGGQSSTAAANPPPTPVPPAQAATMAITQDGSIWNQTSLIGKIFIGFGALLTMASAARLFMA